MNVFIFQVCLLIGCVSSSSVYDAVTTCGNCTCTSHHADCSNRHLEIIPTDLPANITHLNLARNHIQVSSEKQGLCRQYPWLTKLSLAWNGLGTLRQILEGCRNLEQLDLMGNILGFPGPLAFEDLQSLQELSSIEVQELHMGIFENLRKLETLNLTFYGITFQPGVFKELLLLKQLTLTLEKVMTLPEHMLSFNDGNVLKRLTVKGSKVKDFPGDLLKELVNLKELHLDLPQLLELKLQKDRKPEFLKVLEISNVRSLAEDALFGLQFLKTVKLHGIGNLARQDLFKMASSVKELEIVGCSLTELPAGWLHNMVALETLDLSENRLNKLSHVDFLQLTSLKELILSNNKIHDLSSGVFDSLKATLMQLLLNGNQLKKLEPTTFTDLEQLELLDLRKNTIRSISASSLSNLPRLQILRLSGNYINSLDNIVFESFPMLREIDLAENMISLFPETLMASKVVNLFLSANNLQYLPGRKLCQMSRLQKLGLEDNPVFCDCSVRSLHKCLPKLEINGKCSKPEDVEGRNIREVEECIPILISSSAAARSLHTLAVTESTSSLLESSLTSTPVAAPLSRTPILMVLMHASSTPPNSTPSLSASTAPSVTSAPVSFSLIARMSIDVTANLPVTSTSNLKASAQASSTQSLEASVQLSHTPSSQILAASRLSTPSGLTDETDVYYDDGRFEIVRPLIAAGTPETSQLPVTSSTGSHTTQLVEMSTTIKVNPENIPSEDKIMTWLDNDTSLSPGMVQVPPLIQLPGKWSDIGDIITAVFLSLAVTLGILTGVWFYRKKYQSGFYNPATPSIDMSPGSMIQMQTFVEHQGVVPNQKRSNMTIEPHTYHVSH